MASAHCINDIPLDVDVKLLMHTLRISEGSARSVELHNMIAEARNVARPKVIYRVAFIEEKRDDAVIVEGVLFKSRVLRVNLEGAHRVFPFVVTCGIEIEEWAVAISDIVRRFWADTLLSMAVGAAFGSFIRDLEHRYEPGKTATMNPGSLEDWPIQEQAPLFKLLGDVSRTTGVELTENFLMRPLKTISGMQFSTDSDYVNCRLCPRRECPGRRAPYEGDTWKDRYGI